MQPSPENGSIAPLNVMLEAPSLDAVAAAVGAAPIGSGGASFKGADLLAPSRDRKQQGKPPSAGLMFIVDMSNEECRLILESWIWSCYRCSTKASKHLL
ncbi:MAG: hypothetical protein O7G83_05695 [Proteobacteria bacterium]|nr:hypothetical protein [Pseudomonadota bacterium]